MTRLIHLYTFKGWVSRMAKLSVTNESIVNELEKFGLPVFYGGISEKEIKNYNFFYYREESLEGNQKILTQTVNIYYVSMNQEDLKEIEIINALKSIKLNFVRAVYDRLQVEGTNDFVDVVTFICNRKMKVNCNV